MDQPIPRGNDLAPGNLRMMLADFRRKACRRFANQLKIAQGGIVDEPIGKEGRLIEAGTVLDDPFGKPDMSSI